jgi:CheY-like chemotaxis protein
MKIINILLVEDNLGDIRLTEEALKEYKVQVNLDVAQDGEEAMSFLRKEGKYADARTPDLIFLDLNMPKKDGRQVLREIKNDPKLKSIPVVVLTISKAESDVVQAYELHANCYVVKPLDFNQFSEVVKQIVEFWFGIVKLPNKNSNE